MRFRVGESQKKCPGYGQGISAFMALTGSVFSDGYNRYQHYKGSTNKALKQPFFNGFFYRFLTVPDHRLLTVVISNYVIVMRCKDVSNAFHLFIS